VTVEETSLPGVLLLTPRVHRDARGAFAELWRAERYAAAGLPDAWAQDNVSWSRRGVVRGLHFQHPHGQGKLVSVLRGEIRDVAVDVRAGSPTFGRWEAFALSDADARQLWIPPGFAHGFAVRSAEAIVSYKCTSPWCAEDEVTLRWDDPELAIAWEVEGEPVLSEKDRAGAFLRDLPAGRLPPFGGA
jgi:dTDP-4-dehydrorhamnose 3,5-epimerase